MLSDWSVSHYADDILPGVSADFTQPSWNWHTIYPALGGSASSPSTYPLKVTGLTTTGASGTVIPGGSSFYRFSVSANATGTLEITAGSAGSPRCDCPTPLMSCLVDWLHLVRRKEEIST
jgi:hypothetical protein